jgi:hypothetical protein
VRQPKQVQVKLNIPFVGEVSGTWEPDEAERKAAWELYVELVTRIATVELGPAEGLLREALNSLYALFGLTRDILRRYGPQVAPKDKQDAISFGWLAVAILNGPLRPLLARWHPALLAYEATRPSDVSPVDHERAWPQADEFRAELATVRHVLTDFARTLGEVAGAASLLPDSTSRSADWLRVAAPNAKERSDPRSRTVNRSHGE